MSELLEPYLIQIIAAICVGGVALVTIVITRANKYVEKYFELKSKAKDLEIEKINKNIEDIKKRLDEVYLIKCPECGSEFEIGYRDLEKKE